MHSRAYFSSVRALNLRVLCLAAATVVASAQISYVKTPKCDHLKTTEGQFNGYIVDRKLCCMCGPGQKLTSHCNSSHPTSTVCDLCKDELDEYFPFGPHMSPECKKQPLSSCRSPKILIRSITEEARCVCPSGTKDVWGRCTKIQNSRPKTSTLPKAKSSTPARSTVPTISEQPKKSPQNKASSGANTPTTRLPVTHLAEHTTADQAEDSYRNERTQSGKAENFDNESGGVTAVLIAGVVVGFIIILALIVVFYIYRRSNSEDPEKGDGSTESTPTTSRKGLLTREARSNCCKYTWNFRAFQAGGQQDTTGEGQPNSRREAVVEVRPEPERQPMISKDLEIIHEQNEHPNKACPDNLPCGVIEEREAPPQHVPERPVGGRNSRNERFAQEYAIKIGRVIPKNDVKPLFRAIFGKDKETEMDDVYDEHKGQQEIVYQLMRTAQYHVGHQLTPEYILKKLQSLPNCPRTLIEIHEQEMRMEYMRG